MFLREVSARAQKYKHMHLCTGVAQFSDCPSLLRCLAFSMQCSKCGRLEEERWIYWRRWDADPELAVWHAHGSSLEWRLTKYKSLWWFFFCHICRNDGDPDVHQYRDAYVPAGGGISSDSDCESWSCESDMEVRQRLLPFWCRLGSSAVDLDMVDANVARKSEWRQSRLDRPALKSVIAKDDPSVGNKHALVSIDKYESCDYNSDKSYADSFRSTDTVTQYGHTAAGLTLLRMGKPEDEWTESGGNSWTSQGCGWTQGRDNCSWWQEWGWTEGGDKGSWSQRSDWGSYGKTGWFRVGNAAPRGVRGYDRRNRYRHPGGKPIGENSVYFPICGVDGHGVAVPHPCLSSHRIDKGHVKPGFCRTCRQVNTYCGNWHCLNPHCNNYCGVTEGDRVDKYLRKVAAPAGKVVPAISWRTN